MDEKISILMPSYNYASYIREAIESVIKQTYTNWELIIIDDASTDSSLGIIKEYLRKDPRIKLVINEKNLGLAKTLKKGISFAEGNWIAFLECDDIFQPTSLEKKIEAAQNGAELIFSAAEGFDNKNKIQKFEKHIEDINKYIIKLDKSMFIEGFPNFVYTTNIIPTFSVVMVKKEILAGCNFNPLCETALDYYLWAQLCFHKIYYIHEKLTLWRLHNDSYLNRKQYSWLRKFLFSISIFAQTVQNKNRIQQFFIIANSIRKRLIYFNISKNRIKLSLFNNRYIFEKFLP